MPVLFCFKKAMTFSGKTVLFGRCSCMSQKTREWNRGERLLGQVGQLTSSRGRDSAASRGMAPVTAYLG